MEFSNHYKNEAKPKSQMSRGNLIIKEMKKILILSAILFGAFQPKSFAQSKNCDELKGIWYFTLMRGAEEPIYLVFRGCEWKEYESPMGNRKGTVAYSEEKKKFEIIGLTDENHNGKVYLHNTKNYSYISYTDDRFGDPRGVQRFYFVFSRIKHPGYWYDNIKNQLEAGDK